MSNEHSAHSEPDGYRIERDEFSGEMRLTGNRLVLSRVVELHNRGLSAEQMADELPTISLDEIQKTLGFYEGNRSEVDALLTGSPPVIESPTEVLEVVDQEANPEQEFAEAPPFDLTDDEDFSPDFLKSDGPEASGERGGIDEDDWSGERGGIDEEEEHIAQPGGLTDDIGSGERGGIDEDDWSGERGGIDEGEDSGERGGIDEGEEPEVLEPVIETPPPIINPDPINKPTPPKPEPKRWLPLAAAGLISATAVGGSAYWANSQSSEAKKLADANKLAKDELAKAQSKIAAADSTTQAKVKEVEKTLTDQLAAEKAKRDTIEAEKLAALEDAKKKETERLAAVEKAKKADDEITAANTKAALAEKAKTEALKKADDLAAAEKAAQDLLAMEADETPAGLTKYAEKVAEKEPLKASHLYHDAAKKLFAASNNKEALDAAIKSRDAAAKTTDKTAKVSAAYQLYDIYKKVGSVDKAIEIYEEALKIDGLDENSKATIENRLRVLRNRAGSAKDTKKAGGGEGGSARLDSVLASLLIAIQDAPKAPELPSALAKDLADAEASVKKHPDIPSGFLSLCDAKIREGDFYLGAKRFELAKLRYESADKSADDGLSAYKATTDAYKSEGGGAGDLNDLLEAKEVIRKKLANPSLVPPASDLPGLLKRAETDRSALRDAARAIDPNFKDSDDPKVWASSIVAQLARGKNDSIAFANLKTAIRALDPSLKPDDDPKVWIASIAGQLAKAKNDSIAFADLKKAILALDPKLKPTDDSKLWLASIADQLQKGKNASIAWNSLFNAARVISPDLKAGDDPKVWANSINKRLQGITSLEAQIAELRNQLKITGASASNPVTTLDDELTGLRQYGEGVRLFEQGSFAEAEQVLSKASESLPGDPRLVYFRALALRSAGRNDEADTAVRQGIALEHALSSGASDIDRDLVRVQGDIRNWLDGYRKSVRPASSITAVSSVR